MKFSKKIGEFFKRGDKDCMFSLMWILVFNIHIYVYMGTHRSTDHKIRKTTRGREEVLRGGEKGNRTMRLKL